MSFRRLEYFIGAYVLLAVAFAISATFAVHTQARFAEARFYTLAADENLKGAVYHGENTLKLLAKNPVPLLQSAMLKETLGDVHYKLGAYGRAAELYANALADLSASGESDPFVLASLTDRIGKAELRRGGVVAATEIFYAFLDAAGDYAAHKVEFENPDPLKQWFADRVSKAAPLFAEDLARAQTHDLEIGGNMTTWLAIADKMTVLGGHYAAAPEERYAAAALLSAALDIRRYGLGGDHADTLQTKLMLAPVYVSVGRTEDAEQLYLDVFHSRERQLGPNNPDLSLYLKLLAGVYERQERATEAEALYKHIRSLFSDAFGAQRYAANRSRDRRVSIDRPVSATFQLASDFRPNDLVYASSFGVPTAKDPGLAEMTVRLAEDETGNLPTRLASLINVCELESGESLALRSGYRSFGTQSVLFEAQGHSGRVATPGESEHQSGLAVDINVNGRFMRASDRAYACFQRQAFQYGFILSFPPGNNYLHGESVFEPWHWRYVGVETARLYREVGPLDKPLEFLSELPCYRELASNNLSANANGRDVCLTKFAANTNDETIAKVSAGGMH